MHGVIGVDGAVHSLEVTSKDVEPWRLLLRIAHPDLKYLPSIWNAAKLIVAPVSRLGWVLRSRR